jgi:hypothetical protein
VTFDNYKSLAACQRPSVGDGQAGAGSHHNDTSGKTGDRKVRRVRFVMGANALRVVALKINLNGDKRAG